MDQSPASTLPKVLIAAIAAIAQIGLYACSHPGRLNDPDRAAVQKERRRLDVPADLRIGDLVTGPLYAPTGWRLPTRYIDIDYGAYAREANFTWWLNVYCEMAYEEVWECRRTDFGTLQFDGRAVDFDGELRISVPELNALTRFAIEHVSTMGEKNKLTDITTDE